MKALRTVLWKESAELRGNQRLLRVLAIVVLLLGLLPLALPHDHPNGSPVAEVLLPVLGLLHALAAGVFVVANAAAGLVIHQRSGHTLDYLLSTRLPGAAIWIGKVLISAGLGYCAIIVTVLVQPAVLSLQAHGWTWSYLALPPARVLAFAAPATLALYVTTVGTFMAVRVGDQTAAYLLTVLCVAALALPFAFQIVHLHLTAAWMGRAVVVLAAIALVLLGAGLRLFRREMVALYLQE